MGRVTPRGGWGVQESRMVSHLQDNAPCICERQHRAVMPREGQRMFTTGASLLGLAASMFILAMVSRNGAAEPVSEAMALLQKGTTAERRHAAEVLAQIGDQRAAQPLAQ